MDNNDITPVLTTALPRRHSVQGILEVVAVTASTPRGQDFVVHVVTLNGSHVKGHLLARLCATGSR